jgi:thiamine-monophosphate kinase
MSMSAPTLKKIKEIQLIDAMARRLKTKDKSVVVSIGDDTAVVQGPVGKYWLYTVDMLIESVHFKKNEDGKKVGYKAMAASVSDIAAMGGVPRYALVSVGLAKKGVDRLVQALYAGIERCAKKFDITVIGGDTNRSEKLVIAVFMVGEIERHKLVLRSGARTGDHIFVSGPLGGALKGKHLIFEPRVKAARFLVDHFKLTSMIDLSDGLAMDLNRLVSASHAGALIFENRIPKTSPRIKTREALGDGEDFELLFTISGKGALELKRMTAKRKTPFKFYSIGRITDLFSGVRMITAGGQLKDVPAGGFQHF